MEMSVEFTRPFDIPVDDSVTLIANDTVKAWMSWGIYKLGKEQESEGYTNGAKTEAAAVDMFITPPPYIERTSQSKASTLAAAGALMGLLSVSSYF